MKSIKKRLGAFAVALALVFPIVGGMGIIRTFSAFADDSSMSKYFYSRISYDSRAEKFYKAFETLNNAGEFKKGKIELNLTENGIVHTVDVANYVNDGDTQMLKAYAAGRDSFIMDHPDLFYVDLFGTSVSAGSQGQNYVAFLDSSRVLYLYNGGLNTVEAINRAIAAYESKLSEIVSKAKEAGGVKEQIEYVNNYISDHTEYSFGTEVKDGKNIDTPAAAYISTAYGSLVNGKAICGGYSKGFKAVMDRLGIPCVCVQGYAKSASSENHVAHMWNYVEVDGVWYAVDVTWNDTGLKRDKWLLVGGNAIFDSHTEDPIISSSGFELTYPPISPYDFGDTSDNNGMTIDGSYHDSSNNTGKILTLDISFEDKGASELKKENKYLVFRMGYTNKDTKQIDWQSWYDSLQFGIPYSSPFVDKNQSLTCYLHAGIEYIQFAVVDYAPDDNAPDGTRPAIYPNEDRFGENAGKPCYYAYHSEKLTEEHFLVEPSSAYRNSGYGSYLPAPGALSVTPSNTGSLPVDGTYNIKLVYSDTLELAEGKTSSDIAMGFTTSRENKLAQEKAKVSDFQWDGDKTVTFTFSPSKMYIHNSVNYHFIPVGLVGKTSKRVPDPAMFAFKGKSVVCSKVFNDGRLYMNVYGAPQLLDDSDLSVTDFKDEKGNYYAAGQRSQLMLVASKPSSEQEHQMNDLLKQNMSLKDEDILASSTYEISLNLCGVVQKVPNGSYMQVAFGFPEGYDPSDEGTTFKIYHYKHDNSGNITGVEEIPVIVTEYGLIAKVTSFSPFTIVQIKDTSAAVEKNKAKNIYAFVNGAIGGTITSDGKSGITEVVNKNIVYDISVCEGYKIGFVKLNGKVLNPSVYEGGELTLKRDELESNNTLEVAFVTEESVKSYADKGMNVFYGEKYIPSGSSSKALTIAIVVIVSVLVLGGFATFMIMKYLKDNAIIPNNNSKRASRSNAVNKSNSLGSKTKTSSKSVKK